MSDVLCYDTYDSALLCLLSFGPGRRENFGDLMIGHLGQTTQNIAKVSQRVQPTSSATFDHGVNDSTALTSLSVVDEQSVLFFERGWSDGVFYQMVVQFDLVILKIYF